MLEKIGKYEIRLQIGRGGFGVVYEGYDTVIERRVAVKLLRTELFEENQLAEIRVRFKREAQSAGRLSHPHIVTIHDYGEWEGTPYIVMEYLSGRELAYDLKRGVRFALDDVVRIMTQILGALGHAHEHGVVHRDVKPSNVFLLEDGSLKVMDFGIARVEESKDTLTGAILGTPAYMSPEQFKGTRADARSDVYSAGVILYRLLTGDQPFSGTFVTIMQQVLNEEAKPPSGLNPTISAAWDTVVARAMAKKPEARYGNARQFVEAIKLAHQAESDLTIAIEVKETERESTERARREEEERARQAAEAKARAEDEARAERLAESEAQARAEAARLAEEARREKEGADAEARAKREAEERAAAERARAEAEAKAREEAEARAKREAEATARAEAEARAREEAKRLEEEARREREHAEMEARAKREAEERAAREAAERARQAAEAKARAESEARAREEAKRLTEEARRERAEADAKARKEAEARAAAPGTARPGASRALAITVSILIAVAVGGIVLFTRQSAEDQASKAEAGRVAAEARAREEGEKRAKAEAIAREEGGRRLKLEADAARREADAKREAELAAKARAEEETKRAGEEKAKALALKKEEEERKKAELAAKREAEVKAQADAEAEARRRAEAQAKQEAEEKARAEAEARRRTEALAKQEAEAKAKAEASRKAEEARQAAQRPVGAFRDCDGCAEMMPIPAGSFLMGSPASEEGRDNDEGPQHRVSVSRPFAAGKYEVTFDEWDACVRDGGCSHNPADQGWGRGRRPVINVSWRDAKQFTEWLSRKTGKRYRLLTEAEWEYAARAGTATAYSTGSTIATSQANYGGGWRTVTVGSYRPNAFGLYDVHGNVWEWTEDCWNASYSGAPSDGSAWLSGDCSPRVLRGGSWGHEPRHVRSAVRIGGTSDFRGGNLGFRLARTLE